MAFPRFNSARSLSFRRAGVAGGGLAVGGLAAVGVYNATLAGGGIGSDPFTGTSTVFPRDLVLNDHWISFQAVQTNGLAADIFAKWTGSTIGSNFNVPGGSVFLPMPANLSTDYNPEYSGLSPDLGPVLGMALKPYDRALYGNKDLGQEAVLGSGQGAINIAAETAGNVAKGSALSVAQSTFNFVGGNETGFAAALKTFGGVAANPHKIVLFTGVNFRDHTFSWRLSPRNRQESDAIASIIDFFKYYSHPEYVAGGLFFKYPEFFNIRFNHPEYLFTIRPSVCTDVRINYHGQGYPAYIRDADGGGVPAPAEVELSLSFKETEVITKNFLNPGQYSNFSSSIGSVLSSAGSGAFEI